MAVKRINLGSISMNSVLALSEYFIAMNNMDNARSDFNECLQMGESELQQIHDDRIDAVKAGKTWNEAISMFPIDEAERTFASLKKRHKEVMNGYYSAVKKALNYVPENMYYAYIIAMRDGKLTAKGKTVLPDKKQTVINVKQSFRDCIYEYCVNMGFSRVNDEKALMKFAELMALRCSGRKAINKDGKYAVNMSFRQFQKLFTHNMLELLINERGVLIVTDDGKLWYKDYSKKDVNPDPVIVTFTDEYALCRDMYLASFPCKYTVYGYTM